MIPAILLLVVLRLREGKGSIWEKTIDLELLPYLIEETHTKPSRNPLYLVFIAWLLATTALAGPVWRKTPQPVHEREDAVVIIFDLTRSMYTTDVKPNRLIRARRKLLDLLATRNEGVTALVVYAGDAHTVSPLTDDAKTIAEMIPAIRPEIMPAPGSQLAPALRLAHQLFVDAGIVSGRILIVTDEIRDVAEAQTVARRFRNTYPVSVLAVGTAEGAAIPSAAGYLKTSNGTLIIPRVDFQALQDFAAVAGGRYARMTLLDSDLDYLLAEEPLRDQEVYREVERNFDVWFEEGPWLLLLLLPLAALSFRRGWLWSLVFVCLLPIPQAQASIWDDLWETRDQQATKALTAGDSALASQLFINPQWKGTAQYRADEYEGAALTFSDSQTSDGQYNLGNALAKQGDYPKAIDAYDAALTFNPENEDASFNKQLLEKLLEAQQQQEGNDGQDQNSDDSQQSDQDQQDGDSEDQQQSGTPDEQDSEQQGENQQDENQQQEQSQDQQQAEAEPEPLDEEEQQALEQWLRRVPDDPGGLLRRKFEMQYNDRLKKGGKYQHDSSDW